MRKFSIETLSSIGELAISGLTPEKYESAVADLVGDHGLANRIIDWLPEAFGLILVGHMGNITLPKAFKAKDRFGDWIDPIRQRTGICRCSGVCFAYLPQRPKASF